MTEDRGLSEDTIRAFGLGYVPKSVRNVNRVPHECAGRIIFPIYDPYGELVALSTRDFSEDAKQKFWHERYVKSLYLCGLNVSKPWIIQYNLCILVEGEFDLLTLYNVGLNPVVCSLGTTLSLFQISILKRYCNNYYVVFDGDDAGSKGTNRAKKLSRRYNLFAFGVNLIPVYLPDGTDPDSFVRKQGKQEFVKLLREAKGKIKNG